MKNVREYRDCIKTRRDKVGITRHIIMHQELYTVQLPNEEGDMHNIEHLVCRYAWGGQCELTHASISQGRFPWSPCTVTVHSDIGKMPW